MLTFWIISALVAVIVILSSALIRSLIREQDLREKIERYETERRAWGARSVRH